MPDTPTPSEATFSTDPVSPGRMPTGVPGLDEVLRGGLPGQNIFLVQGTPGTGKTTLAMQFLLEGVRRGERSLLVSLSETADELAASAASHGWSLDGVDVFVHNGGEDTLQPEEQYTVFDPAEVETGEFFGAITDEVERVRPARLVIDSVGHIRLLARDPLRYARQILALKQYLRRLGCTVLLTDEADPRVTRMTPRTLASGVIELTQLPAEYGSERRQLRVVKMRGVDYSGGLHDFTIRPGGVAVYPRLVAHEYRDGSPGDPVPSGIPELDAILGGGLERGTTTAVLGNAGSGKSSFAAHYAYRAAERGERAALFLFEETVGTLVRRSAGLGADLRPHVRSGAVEIQAIDPAEVSPGEFSHSVRRCVEEGGATTVVIDSLNSYINAMPGERYVLLHLRELFMYLRLRGVLSLCVIAQHGLPGGPASSPVDISFLADNVVLLRFFEFAGAVRQAISVLKKRGGRHERQLREISLGPEGMKLGEPLTQFHGVFTGVPTYIGAADALMSRPGPHAPVGGDGNGAGRASHE